MKRARSSYSNLRLKRKLNESTQRRDQSFYNSKELDLDNYQPNQLHDGVFHNNNKDYGVNPNEYKTKYSNQLKRKNMFKELWNKNKNKKDTLGLLDTIKVQNKQKKNIYNNIIGDMKGVVRKKRIASAGTFCNIPIKSKKQVSFNKYNSSININSLTKINPRNIYNSININSEINTLTKSNSNIFLDNTKDKDKDKFSHEFSSIIIHNEEIRNSLLSPVNSYNISNINNYKYQKDEVEKNDNDEISKFLEKTKNNQSNYENNSDILRLRTEYLIKFSKINDLLKRFTQITDCFRVNLRDLYNSNIRALIKVYDFCNNFVLNELKIGEPINLQLLSSLFINLHNFCLQVSKTQKYFFDELHYLKNENLNLKQKLNIQETELNQKNNEINEINKLITKYDLNSKIKIGKKLEFNVDKIRKKFNNQEASYVLTIYKLEEEIKNLTELLKMHKPELNNNDKIKEKYKILGKQYEEDMGRLSRINIEKDMNLKLLLQRNSSLIEKISELESEITKLKDKEEKDEEKNIYCNAKIENLNKIIEKNNENIESLKKEIENYKKSNNKENLDIKTSKIIFMSPK